MDRLHIEAVVGLLCGILTLGAYCGAIDYSRRFILFHHHKAVCSIPQATDGSFKCTDVLLYEGSTCKLTCNHGFHPDSSHTTIKCLSTATWSPRAHCHHIKCPARPTISNGAYKCPRKDHKINDKCHLECEHGFEPSSIHSNITCKASGTWSTPSKCVSITCPQPKKLDHGYYKCATIHYKVNTVCLLHCDSNYKPSQKQSDIMCKHRGTWSPAANCIPIICPSPPTVNNGAYQCSSSVHTVNTVCKLHCNHYFKPSRSTSSIKCQTSGMWTTPTRCVHTPCRSPPVVSHGKFSCSSGSVHNPGSTCSLSCSSGHKPSNSSTTITCLSSSKWSISATCVHEVQCQRPTISHGNFHCSSNTIYKHGSTCLLTCATGYTPTNSNTTITSLETAKWSASATCIEIICQDPKPVPHGRYVCSKPSPFHQNDLCQLQCNHGYRATSELIAIMCLSTSTWTSSASCEEMKCYAPPIAAHGQYKCGNSTSYKIDTVCSLQCDQGYKPSSHSDISCVDEDDWSASGTCEEIQCQDPPKVDNGQYHCLHNAMHNLDEVCHLQCNNGYGISSKQSEIYCLTNGSWSGSASCTEVLCPDPPQIQHGTYQCHSPNVHKLNDACQLKCDEGFKPSLGQHTIFCQMQNVWTTPATCEEKRCDGLPKVDNGNVICNSSVHLINTACLVHCDAGFKLASLSDQVFCLEDETWASVSCVAQEENNPGYEAIDN